MSEMRETDLPPAVRLVRDFVNTLEPQLGAESLTSPDRLRDWLAERQLVPADARLGPPDLTAALTIREGLRAVLLGHNDHRADPAAVGALNDALARFPLRLTFAGDRPHLASASSAAFEQALAELLDAIRQCGEDDTWPNLKVCARDSCRWAFYDASRNHARRWCSMAGCGNHVKMQRAYAARKRRRQPVPDSP